MRKVLLLSFLLLFVVGLAFGQSDLHISQSGTGNDKDITQNGNNHWATVVQRGNRNECTITQPN